MISCVKCGFGHKTVEEVKACKSWTDMIADAAQAARPITEPAVASPTPEEIAREHFPIEHSCVVDMQVKNRQRCAAAIREALAAQSAKEEK